MQEEQYILNMMTVRFLETSIGANSSEHLNLHLSGGMRSGGMRSGGMRSGGMRSGGMRSGAKAT